MPKKNFARASRAKRMHSFTIINIKTKNMQKTLGGDRLGSGKKMKVNLHGFERSTHDLSYLWRSTISAGTLVPFMSKIILPGDTFDIDLNCEILTHPTTGPLFGTYKVQLDVFQAPIRLYNSLLHNNALGIGLQMSKVKLPTITLSALSGTLNNHEEIDVDNSQINPSALLSYLGIRGVGNNPDGITRTRTFNAVPILAYWEIYKNYYANKQEEIGAVIHTPAEEIIETVDSIETFIPPSGGGVLPQYPTTGTLNINTGGQILINWSVTQPIPAQIIIGTAEHGEQTAEALAATPYTDFGGTLTAAFRGTLWGETTLLYWRYADDTDVNTGKPAIATFPLENIDQMRNAILAFQSTTTPFDINNPNIEPYKWLNEIANNIPTSLSSQEGLALKTYQSDLFNNWLQTEWIDGASGINTITAIDTTSGSFTIDTLNLSKKVYDMLNRIAVSGGSYDDWLDAVYDHDRYQRCESPMYMGGLIRELAFQEVVSNSQAEDQPLGTLAGKGIMTQKRKGGHIVIKADEPSYIIGILSLTPRVDYSQGNSWDTSLMTLDDLHKPSLDEIGFQELTTEQMAWWDTYYDTGTGLWTTRSAGKQPAWINYMTSVNETRGNFAIATNEMFMTLNRRYEVSDSETIKDLTSYIDPSKFNFIFAETKLDAQNFWAQIAVDITARRKMSAKIMPNL